MNCRAQFGSDCARPLFFEFVGHFAHAHPSVFLCWLCYSDFVLSFSTADSKPGTIEAVLQRQSTCRLCANCTWMICGFYRHRLASQGCRSLLVFELFSILVRRIRGKGFCFCARPSSSRSCSFFACDASIESERGSKINKRRLKLVDYGELRKRKRRTGEKNVSETSRQKKSRLLLETSRQKNMHQVLCPFSSHVFEPTSRVSSFFFCRTVACERVLVVLTFLVSAKRLDRSI